MAARRSRHGEAAAAEELTGRRRHDELPVPVPADVPATSPAVRHYQLLFERAPLPYVVTDFVGTILAANRAAAVMLKRPSELLQGKALGAFVPLERRGEFREMLASLPLHDSVRDWRITLLPHHGAPVDVAMHANVLDAVWDGRDAIFWIVRPRRQRPAH